MPCKWKPDTCDCKIEYTNDYDLVKVWNKCPMHEDIIDSDIVSYLVAENQSANKFYINWSEQEINDNHDLIDQYKKDFKAGLIKNPPQELPLAQAKTEYLAEKARNTKGA